MANSPNTSGASTVVFGIVPSREGDTITDNTMREVAQRLLGSVETVQASQIRLELDGGSTVSNSDIALDNDSGAIVIRADFTTLDTVLLRTEDGQTIPRIGGGYTIPGASNPQTQTRQVTGDGSRVFEFDDQIQNPEAVYGIPVSDPDGASFFLVSVDGNTATFNFSGFQSNFQFRAVAL